MTTEIETKVQRMLKEKKMCLIATTDGVYVDNAMVAYLADGFHLYFGSFSDTLKGHNIAAHPQVAVCIDNIQLHGTAKMIPHGTDYYREYRLKYLEKFPDYAFYFELEKNELYQVTPLVIWYYDSSYGVMHREMLVFDHEYYKTLKPYEAPARFQTR